MALSSVIGPLLSVSSKLMGGSKKGSSRQQLVVDPRVGFAAERTYAMQAAQNAAKISDPGRRMVAEQEGRAKEVNRTREVMAMLRDAQTNPKVRRAIIAQAERQGNISPAIQAAKYNLSDPLKRDTDTRTALLKLPKTATLTS
jgi:hypothetical protein